MELFGIGEKCTFEDLGLRHALVGDRAATNKILEKVVGVRTWN